MLHEINVNELIREIEDPVLIIKDGEIVTLEDVFAGTRILIDRPTTVKKVIPETKAPSITVAPKKRRSPSEIQDIVLKEWRGGERSIMQIVKATGIDYKTVRKYIPMSAEG
jgi:hypothetical protein